MDNDMKEAVNKAGQVLTSMHDEMVSATNITSFDVMLAAIIMVYMIKDRLGMPDDAFNELLSAGREMLDHKRTRH